MTDSHHTRAHDQWSASATARNWTCPGAIAMASLAGEEVESLHAARGTAAHEVIEKTLHAGAEARAADLLKHVVKTAQHEIVVDQEIVDAAQVCVDYARERKADSMFVERRLSLAKLNPPFQAGGTCDITLLFPKLQLIEIVDFKNGMGVVEVNENKQTRSYALMALLELDPAHARFVKYIIVTIVQPRAPHEDGRIRSETFSVGDLIAWTDELLTRMGLAREALDEFQAIEGNRVLFDEWAERWLRTGACTFCPAEAFCPRLRKEALSHAPANAQKWFEGALDAVPDVSNNPTLQSPEELERALDGVEMLENWIRALRSHAHALAERGAQFDHWRLADKIGNRAYVEKDNEKLAALLREKLALADDVIFEKPDVRSIAQLEKALGKRKKELAALEGVVWHRPKTGTNLVRVDKTERPTAATLPQRNFETPTS